jgi:hypothetical protein
VYQRIDISQSIAIKDIQYKSNEPTRLLGNESNPHLKIMTKNISLNIIDCNDNTFINELLSPKNTELFNEDIRFPQFMRRAVWLNSRIPNFANRTIIENMGR